MMSTDALLKCLCGRSPSCQCANSNAMCTCSNFLLRGRHAREIIALVHDLANHIERLITESPRLDSHTHHARPCLLCPPHSCTSSGVPSLIKRFSQSAILSNVGQILGKTKDFILSTHEACDWTRLMKNKKVLCYNCSSLLCR